MTDGGASQEDAAAVTAIFDATAAAAAANYADKIEQLGGADRDKLTDDQQVDANANAAFAAACMAFGTTTDQLTMTIYWLAPDGDYIDDAIAEAADFIRQWPDAPLDALPIHLKRAGFDVPSIGPREKAAWTVFRATLMALDAADKEIAAAAAPPAPLPGGGMGTIGLRPAPGPFDVTGFATIDD